MSLQRYIVLLILGSLGKDFRRDGVHRSVQAITQLSHLLTQGIDVILLDRSEEVLRKIYSSLIGLLDKIIIHRLLELLPVVSLTSDSKAHLSKSFFHTSPYRLYKQILLRLIHSEAYSL